MADYQYNVSDFPNGFDIGNFSEEVRTSSITKTLKTIKKTNNNITIKFDSTLSVSELILLNDIISNHNIPLNTSNSKNIDTTRNPISTDSSYTLGTIWINTNTNIAFICVDNTSNNAIWEQINDEIGPTGPQGPQGVQGFQGHMGFFGPTGPQGFQGTGGLQGNQGTQGPPGPQGYQGPQGSSSGIIGPTGVQGPPGSSGTLNFHPVNSNSYTITTTDNIIGINYTNTASVTLTLPLASTIDIGHIYHIKDQQYNCKTNNIIINATSNDLIDSQSNFIMNVNGMSISLYCDGSTNFYLY